MKSSLKALITFAILSSAVSLDLGHLLGLRRNWRDLSSQPSIPQVVEVVRWRQPVCVVPGPGVPPCLIALRKHQVEYERNSAQGVEAKRPVEPKSVAKDRKTGKNELEKAVWELGLGSEREIEKFCKDEYKNSRSGVADSPSVNNDRVDVCKDWFDQWDAWSGRIQGVDPEISIKGANGPGTSRMDDETSMKKTSQLGTGRKELIEQFCSHKLIATEESDAKAAGHLAKIMLALREFGILRKGDDASALDHICDSLVFAPRILSPRVVDSVQVESVDRVELDGSEGSARSGIDDEFTLNLRSSTPGMEEARLRRQGKYLTIAGSSTRTNPSPGRSPPAIYVTKVLNSPVTATLVANNCFPDIGVPLCDEYQETLTIYKEPPCSGHQTTHPQGSGGQGFPAAPLETVEQEPEDNGSHETVQENTESSDFWDDPSSPHFDDGTAVSEPQRPTGLLDQAVQHVLSKPGVVAAIPPGVIEAIANNPAIIEALANGGGQPGGESGDSQISATKPQVVTDSGTSGGAAQTTTSRPGFISSFLDIKRPGILDKFWNPAFSIFNRSTTAKPEAAETTGQPSGGHSSGGSTGHGHHGQVVEAIQSLIHKPLVVGSHEKPTVQPVLVIEPQQKPGIFDSLWNPAGGFGLFDKHSTTTTDKPATTEEPANEFTSAIGGDEIVQPKPTQAPGLFGGLFGNPSKPIGASGVSGILEIGNSILQHVVNKPLIIERPGDKPLLVEKPIYIQEKPAAAAGLLNFFVPASDKPILNVEHEVIKEPVYVYQKPQTASGILNHIFGTALSKPAFFQGWATFGKHPEKPTEQVVSNNRTEEIPRGGQETKTAFGESATSTTVRETHEPIPTDSTENVEETEEGASSTDDGITEGIATVRTTSKSASPVDDIAEETIEANVESTGPEVEATSSVNDGKIAIDVATTSASSADVVTSSSIENEVREAEVAVEAEAMLENSKKNLADTSEAAAQEAEGSEEESVIDNEA